MANLQPDRDRLLAILRTYVECNEVPTVSNICVQFHYETGREADLDLLATLWRQLRRARILVRKRLKAQRLTS